MTAQEIRKETYKGHPLLAFVYKNADGSEKVTKMGFKKMAVILDNAEVCRKFCQECVQGKALANAQPVQMAQVPPTVPVAVAPQVVPQPVAQPAPAQPVNLFGL